MLIKTKKINNLFKEKNKTKILLFYLLDKRRKSMSLWICLALWSVFFILYFVIRFISVSGENPLNSHSFMLLCTRIQFQLLLPIYIACSTYAIIASSRISGKSLMYFSRPFTRKEIILHSVLAVIFDIFYYLFLSFLFGLFWMFIMLAIFNINHKIDIWKIDKRNPIPPISSKDTIWHIVPDFIKSYILVFILSYLLSFFYIFIFTVISYKYKSFVLFIISIIIIIWIVLFVPLLSTLLLLIPQVKNSNTETEAVIRAVGCLDPSFWIYVVYSWIMHSTKSSSLIYSPVAFGQNFDHDYHNTFVYFILKYKAQAALYLIYIIMIQTISVYLYWIFYKYVWLKKVLFI